jgi:heat shock protein HslJ
MKYLLLIVCLLVTASCKSSKQTTTTTSSITPTPNSPLENTFWQLAEVNGKPTATPADGNEAHIKLLSGGELKGYAGCNQLMGKYTTAVNGSIKFEAGSTKRMCDNMATENFMMSAIRSANRYVIDGELLKLYKDKELLAFFKDMHI